MPSKDRVQLLEAKLELTRNLAPAERAELSAVTLPATELSAATLELDKLLRDHNAFAAAVVEGMVVQTLQIGEQSGLQLLGPGDLLLQPGAASPPWLECIEFRAPGPARIAILGDSFLAVTRLAPRLISALYECVADQMQRVTAQLVICQLPRVDERVLAMMWLLAESWGQVTPAGVRLPLALTHETLGAMVGARRPTVTLALRKLSNQGSILHQDSGWLLVEPPPEPGPTPKVLAPELAGVSVSRWAPPEPPLDPSVVYADLTETVRQLREQHQYNRQETRDQLRRIRAARTRMKATRQQIAEGALRRGRPPSS